MNRRDLFKTASGITLALTVGSALDPRHAFAQVESTPASQNPPRGGDPLLLFTAQPYLQPGAFGGPLPKSGTGDTIAIAWQTFANTPGAYRVEVNGHRSKARFATRIDRWQTMTPRSYATMPLRCPACKRGSSTAIAFCMKASQCLKAAFTARKGRGTKTRFVSFGDNSYGDISDRYIAFQTFQARPDFVVNTGDVVYEDGTVDEFARYYFPVHNADVAGARIGAPLLRSTLVYPVIANHDVHAKDAKKAPVADFDKHPDSLGYFTNFYLPRNGFAATNAVPTMGKQELIDAFKKAAGDRFPNQANYSYDNGDGHFLCLDANVYVDPTDPALQAWIKNDLMTTDAAWKFVVYHHPAFNAGGDHYSEQHMRALSPLFEECGVTIVLHGHEHNYQRTRPFRFTPKDTSAAKEGVGTKNRLTPGTFVIDRVFDGASKTKADGITYITTGAGGKHLYDVDWNTRPDLWRHKEDNNADYVAAFVSDRHSLSVFDMDAHTLSFAQVDQWGNTLDKVVWTK